MSTVSEIRYTPDSLKFQDLLQNLVMKKLRALVKEKVERQKRYVVTAEDIKGCVQEAFRQALSELQQEGILERQPTQCPE
jgi:predicted transcriptional regulator of viral defense system